MLAAGLASGFLAGLLGVGGGIISVPVMFQIFTLIGLDESVLMHLAVGTSLAAIVPTAFVSARSHFRKQAIDGAVLRAWLPFVLLGACAGSVVASQVRGPVLSGVFAAGAFSVALYMLATRKSGTGGAGKSAGGQLPGQPLSGGLALSIGGVSTMMGIGGGTFSVPVLKLFGYPIHKAVGTAAAFGLVIAIPGAIGFMLAGSGIPARPPGSIGYVNLIGLALLLPGTMLTAPLGARVAHALSPMQLQMVFALFLLATSIRMALSLL